MIYREEIKPDSLVKLYNFKRWKKGMGHLMNRSQVAKYIFHESPTQFWRGARRSLKSRRDVGYEKF